MRLLGIRVDFSETQEIKHRKTVAGHEKPQHIPGSSNTFLGSVPTKLPERGSRLET